MEKIVPALRIDSLPIDDKCVGSRWIVDDEDQLSKLIAIILMGQAAQASHIINTLLTAQPAFSNDALKEEAIVKLTVQDTPQEPRIGYPRWQRDGLLFEIISWISAKQLGGNNRYIKDPHISSTTQGIDGLMIELNDDGKSLFRSTVFEDKCTTNPRATFVNQVIPAFLDRHKNKRNAELISCAASLIKLSGADDSLAIAIAAEILNVGKRYYRAGFALDGTFDSDSERIKLFKDYDQIDNIQAEQRIGAHLIVNCDVRQWFDELSLKVVAYLKGL